MTRQRADDRTPQPIAGRHPAAIARFVCIALVVLAADLLVKSAAFEHVAGDPVVLTREMASLADPVPPHDAVPVVPRVLNLKLTVNRGAAFGLGEGGRGVFIVVALVAVTIVTVIFWRSRPRAYLLHIALALLLAGAIGNLYDRALFGMVRDMFWLFPGVKLPFGLRWPGGNDELYPWIFNVADAAMCVAMAMLLWVMYRGDRATPDAPAETPTTAPPAAPNET